ncbi:MAG: AAA family ATPase [Candidatus Devosia phytovorans]|uniref:AAA family ATPase n=1 Tax=Candidatus Devosia phytovorans TaxID=3121372 RepID=A0AAJ6AYR3_9HYPH|nr:AAA family ATPase [Devosia sp.]WEK03875.1 MAG: AAA family ATPase [Devosia sp.]
MSEIVIPLGKKLISSDSALALAMIDRMFRDEARVALETGKVCVVIKVPSFDWVAPMVAAAKLLGEWNEIVAPKPSFRDDFDDALKHLAAGGRVLCVSASAATSLPKSIMFTADYVVEMPYPGDEEIAAVIKAVTGFPSPDLPPGIGRRLDFGTLCAAMRRGSSPEKCVERLTAAMSAVDQPEPGLADAPYLHELKGYGQAMDWANRVVADVESWREGKLPFSAIQATCVLASQPGLGKSSLMRSLARTARLPLFASSVGSWFAGGTGSLDGVIKQMDQLFRQAAEAGPAIVFLDELEALPDRRTLDSRYRDWWTPVIGHMLTILDGAATSKVSNLIIVGATNFADRLDGALTRPGRLSPVLEIDPPDADALAHIFRQHLGDDLPDMDLAAIARLCVGISGAEVAGMVKGARAAARADGRVELLASDLRSSAVPATKEDPATLRRVCLHEAGHAVAAHLLGVGSVERVGTIRSGSVAGATDIKLRSGLLMQSELFDQARMGLAGMAAEMVVLGERSTGGGGDLGSDLARVTELLASCILSFGFADSMIYQAGSEEIGQTLKFSSAVRLEVDRQMKTLFEEVCELLEANRSTLLRVASTLEVERVIDGRRFLEVVSVVKDAERLHA